MKAGATWEEGMSPGVGTTRTDVLLPFYHRLLAEIGVPPGASALQEVYGAETLAPHPRLRQLLQSDPSMSALLPGSAAAFAVGDVSDAPFSVSNASLVVLHPVLLDDAAALSAAARWGMEGARLRALGSYSEQDLEGLVRHGVALISALPRTSQELLGAILEPSVGLELTQDGGACPSRHLLNWMNHRVGGSWRASTLGTTTIELESTVEQLLVAGGDTRLRLDTRTGQNRYGVPPRPRPEAVHFSSSTASAISEYGFLYCDLLRRDLLTAIALERMAPAEARACAANATGRAILRLLNLNETDAAVSIAPSGTDAELIAVLVARAGAAGRPVANLLIAPDESGRGLRHAAKGHYFDDVTSTGAEVTVGSPILEGLSIVLHEVPIRDNGGRPRRSEQIDADFLAAGRAALSEGKHVLAHLILSSKTGLSAPSREAVNALIAVAPDQVDVVVDACQMRTPFSELGEDVKRGWMLQVSGSKFLTGPPFSGALVVPASFVGRAASVGNALALTEGVGHASDWTFGWSSRMPTASGAQPSFGPIFRWIPALLEAELFRAIDKGLRHSAFARFRQVVVDCVTGSPWLRCMPGDADGIAGGKQDALARLSILSFAVMGARADGSIAMLSDVACRQLFELLNRDVSDLVDGLDPVARALARLQAHIGQPVTIAGPDGPVTVLRMVLGARFFTIVGFAGPGASEAALLSEIADAKRAIAKVELLASRWWELEKAGNRL